MIRFDLEEMKAQRYEELVNLINQLVPCYSNQRVLIDTLDSLVDEFTFNSEKWLKKDLKEE